MEKLIVGKIVNTHGIKGELRVQSITDSADDRYQVGNHLYVEDHFSVGPLQIASHRVHKSFDLIKFDGLDHINEVKQFVGSHLYVALEDIDELEADEYYIHELIGCQVLDESGRQIGELAEVIDLPANDVWVVARQEKEDLLLPNIKEVILDVDIDKKLITIHLMEGLDPNED